MTGFQEFRGRHMVAGMRAMLPIEQAAAEATAEILALEEAFADETKCQAAHEDGLNRVCSGPVTAVFSKCNGPSVVCSNTADHVFRAITAPETYVCGFCGVSYVRNHWRITEL